MKRYRVKGTIEVVHADSRSFLHLPVDEVVEATSKVAAKDRVLSSVHSDGGLIDWVGSPSIVPHPILTTDQLLRILGPEVAPLLPGFEGV